MEELLELKQLLQHGDIDNALLLVEDLEEMGKKAIVNNIRSDAKVLLLHLIKQKVEKRTTKSWEASIHNAITEIQYLNQRPKGKGVYLDNQELSEAVASAWQNAVIKASLEAAEGLHDARAIEQMVNRVQLVEQAIDLIQGQIN